MYIPGLIAHLCDPGSLEAEQEDLHGQPELHNETEEMIQRLEVLTAFPENPSLDPSTHLGELTLSFHCMGSRDPTQLVVLDSEHSHLFKSCSFLEKAIMMLTYFLHPSKILRLEGRNSRISISLSCPSLFFLSILLLLVCVSHLTFVDHPSWKQCETRISGGLTCFCWRKELQEGGAG